MDGSFLATWVDGEPQGSSALEQVVPMTAAHFTAMQVRGGAVRGLDLHLERLRGASEELFETHVPTQDVREQLRAALASSPPDVSLSCYVALRPGVAPERSVGRHDLVVVVRVSEPVDPPAGPLALGVVEHERFMPQVKHVGEIAKTVLRRRAAAGALDDVAFLDRSGRLTEATIWNLAFWDGEQVVWPEGGLLRGTSMQVLARRLEDDGVPQAVRPVRLEDLTSSTQAVVMNSWTPAVPVSALAGRELDPARDLVELLHRAYDAEVPEAP